ncbi:MAG: AraC family transcriptional regulator [Tissierellia bacterium]|nr:AraC family transcriptional regulator [Tissierellia bacterium]
MSYPHEAFLKKAGFIHDPHCQRYSSLGKTFTISSDHMDGYYWFFEMENFVINIHDFKVKKDHIFVFELQEDEVNPVSISFVKMANGEFLSPYQKIRDHSIIVNFYSQQPFKFLLHGNFPFFSIGFEYKADYLNTFIPQKYAIAKEEIRDALTSLLYMDDALEIEKIVDEILPFRETHLGSRLFYEVKAQEVLSIALNNYFTKQAFQSKMELDDREAIANVQKYICDHYAMDISQDLLCMIATMSKTKLKERFKEKNGMTITEYIQRRRISAAENLLMSTTLNVGDVAKLVGYTSHSRFSQLFKKYKGIHPRTLRTMMEKKQ